MNQEGERRNRYFVDEQVWPTAYSRRPTAYLDCGAGVAGGADGSAG